MIAIDHEKENQEIARRYKDLLRATYLHLNEEDKKLIRKAFDLALDAHKDQRRRSGEPYIYHPLEVAKIVSSEIGLGAVSIAAALIHDVVEDTEYTILDIEKQFGVKLASIIDGLTKISIINSGNKDISAQAENYRKLLLTLSEDVRVILVKIADRLHNMRTLSSLSSEKQLKIASETIYIYAPLAHRMGLYNIKTELEDLSLKYTEPDIFNEIERKLEESREVREKYIKDFIAVVKDQLDKEGLEYSIKGRPKSIHSIRKKMAIQNVGFEQVYDLFAIRIIYKGEEKDEKFIAWKIYSILTDAFVPNPKRMRDWISQPKSTGYESLHITVMGLLGRWVEVQIRSERMDEVAEKGIAAHYKYKQGGEASEDSKVDEWVAQLREVLENQEGTDTLEFMDNFKMNLYAKEIFVFTPKGALKSLQKGATALDFAYDVHSNIGDTCLGAKVNGRLVPLSYQLQSGDQVEIITSPNQKPKIDWLDFVATSRAKAKIKAALKSDRKLFAEDGKEILARKLKHLKIAYNETTINNMATFFHYKTSQDLFFNVAAGAIGNVELKRYADETSTGLYNNIMKRFRAKKIQPKVEEEKPTNLDMLVFGADDEKLDFSLATCCNPIAGDKVFGFITINKGITVHKMDCPNAISLRANYAYRILKAKWIDSNTQEFKAIIHIQGIDRMGLLNDITLLLSENLHLNISNMNISSDDGIFDGKLTVTVHNKEELENTIDKLKKVEGIQKVKRNNKN